MIEPQILYGVTCDRCGDTLINSNDNSAWYDRSTAEEEASEEAILAANTLESNAT